MPSELPSYEGLVDDPSNFNLLLMGKHGSNVDTMIFANVNAGSRKVTLVSVPRDLYYEERKINSVYGDFGLREQVRVVEEVLGFRIHRYALIDMYAFRDVIDLLGGVDIVLESDLVDPSYRTCDNGVCSTLHYEAGEHHLDGTQALRIARSRHTTSDYSRAERQQLILEGLQEKARSLGFGDAGTFRSLLKTALAAVDTNIGFDEALRYYFRYQNFDISRGHVISTGNVLENVQVPVDYRTSLTISDCEEGAAECETQYAIYTLQPKDEDWDWIRWYVQSVL